MNPLNAPDGHISTMAVFSGSHLIIQRNPLRTPNPQANRQIELLELHNRLLSQDPVATEEFFTTATPELERRLRARFPNLAAGVDPDIYVSAVYEALTDYFKNPGRYDPTRSGLMTYLSMASKRDLQNLLRKESRHVSGRISLESVELNRSDGNDVQERIAEDLDGQRIVSNLKRGMTSDERAVFTLMLEGERSTRVAAEALNIGHLAPRDQAREVKRVKDRIKKRIQRSGITRS